MNAILPMEQSMEWYNHLVQVSKEILQQGRDFGVVPGVSKPSLLKPGAEKLRVFFSLGSEIEQVKEENDRKNDFYDVTYKATIKNGEGKILAQCEGSCNVLEDKYRYRRTDTTLKPSKEEGAKLKAEGKGKRKKNGNDWVRCEKAENDNKFQLKNTIQKMAQKRAFVGAILMATGASEFYTQDVEDMEMIHSGEVIETVVQEVKEEFTNERYEAMKQAVLEGKFAIPNKSEALIAEIQKKYTVNDEMKEKLNALYSTQE